MCKYPCPTSAQCWSVKIDKFQKDSARIEVKLWNKIPRIFLRKLSKEFSANCYLIYKRRVTIFKSPWLLKKSRYRDTLAKGFNVCFFSVLSFKSQWLLVLMHCSSVSAVLIRSLNFCVLFIFSAICKAF